MKRVATLQLSDCFPIGKNSTGKHGRLSEGGRKKYAGVDLIRRTSKQERKRQKEKYRERERDSKRERERDKEGERERAPPLPGK